MSSLAANFPLPHRALYSGTKAFLTNLTVALRHEITNKNLYLSTLSPGGIKTELSQAPELKHLDKYNMPVHLAAKDAIRSFMHGKYNYTPGWINRIALRKITAVIPTKFITVFLGKRFAKSIAVSKKEKTEVQK